MRVIAAWIVIVVLTVLGVYHTVTEGRDPVGDDCTSFQIHEC